MESLIRAMRFRLERLVQELTSLAAAAGTTAEDSAMSLP